MPLEPFSIMIISRGHGRGHAVPDMAIATDLRTLLSNLHFQFVSYAAGADAYRAYGYDVLDLQLPDTPPLLDSIVALTRVLDQTKPTLIVSHEEIAALPVAKGFGIPCIFITDFFTDPTSMAMRALKYAAEIIFTGESGLYTEPPYIRDKIIYVGRAVRPFGYTLVDRYQARRELDISTNALVVLCQPGAWLEAQVPLARVLSVAWQLISTSPKQLIWLAGNDYDRLKATFCNDPTILVLKDDWRLDRLMVASNILITKANRMTVYEAAALGLPSISLSNLSNWPDDVALVNVRSNTALILDSTSPECLAELILVNVDSNPTPAIQSSGGVAKAACRIAYHVERIRLMSE